MKIYLRVLTIEMLYMLKIKQEKIRPKNTQNKVGVFET